LLLLSFTAWFVRYGLQVPVGFNTVFYAGMVGFFGVILYNWMNNVDATDYLSTVPVSVPQVIRTKLIAFLLMTTWIGVGFVVIIAWLNADTRLLWLAIPIVLVTSAYIVVMTAYLTGLRTNSFLFDPGVLARFSVMSMLPDFGLTILSFTIDRDLRLSAIGIGLFGMRPYEGRRVSAYAQGALGFGLALFLFGDLLGTLAPYLVVPVFLGMAWIDPLAALARRRSWPRSGVVAAYFVLFLATEYAMLGIREWSWQFLFAVIATGSAMIVEGPKHRQLDDDLLMLVVPLAVLTAVVLIFRPPILV